MLIPMHDTNQFLLSYDICDAPADENLAEQSVYTLEIDGTGKLRIVNSGGTSAAEGGMGSGDNSGKEKGELKQPVTGEKGGKPNTDADAGWDPIGENIDKETAKKSDE